VVQKMADEPRSEHHSTMGSDKQETIWEATLGEVGWQSVAALRDIFKEYGQCVGEQEVLRKKWRGELNTWTEQAMKEVEERAAQPVEEVLKVNDQVPDTGFQKHDQVDGSDSEEVVAEVMLQHKERILDEMSSSDELWQLQPDTWVKKCKICRVREGRRRTHDWRDCTVYPEDREAVEEAHGAVVAGTLSITNAAQMGEFCKGCNRKRQFCWMQVKGNANRGCR